MWPDSPGPALGRGRLAGLIRASLPRGQIPAGGQGEAVVLRFPLTILGETRNRSLRCTPRHGGRNRSQAVVNEGSFRGGTGINQSRERSSHRSQPINLTRARIRGETEAGTEKTSTLTSW